MNAEDPNNTTASSHGPDVPEQPRVLGPWAAFSIVAGSMLGVGIFLFPGRIAQQIQHPWSFLGLWLLGGVISLAGAVACGELGAMLPRAGGDYVFHRKAFGPNIAFATGWVLFGAIFPGSIASMAAAIFYYQFGSLLGIDFRAALFAGAPISVGQLGGLLLVFLLTLLNVRGTKESGSFQISLTLAALFALLAMAGIFLMVGGGHPAPFAIPTSAPAIGLGGLISGLLMVYFAYSGWLNIIYVAGEVKEPAKELPRSMLAGTGVVTALYLLLCVAFISVLGMDGLRKAGTAWTDAGSASAQAMAQPWLGKLLLLLIAAVILTSINATILAGARVAYAMAQKGAFWAPAGQLNQRQVPARALWLQAWIAGIFLLSGTFDQIVEATSIAMLVTGTMTVLALFVLRFREPQQKRPYKAWGYPFFPLLYLAFSLLAMGVKTWEVLSAKASWKAWLPLSGLLVFAVAWAYHKMVDKPKQDNPSIDSSLQTKNNTASK